MRAGQSGVAIVLAMGVVALAAMAATAIMVSQSTWSRASELTADHAQAQLLVQAGVDWVRATLSDDARVSNVDYLGEPWALRLPPMPVENGELSGYIEDQQGAFNLNNLINADGALDIRQYARFTTLLSILGLPEALAPALVDWMDSDSLPQPGGAEDSYYLSSDPPYLVANRPLIDVAELSLVRGFNDSVMAALRPYVTALPTLPVMPGSSPVPPAAPAAAANVTPTSASATPAATPAAAPAATPIATAAPTPLNVNTATPEVLAAVTGMDLGTARDLVAQRDRAYFRSIADFNARLPKGVTPPTLGDISVSSNFFLATLRVTVGGASARGLVLLARPDMRWPVILWRKYL